MSRILSWDEVFRLHRTMGAIRVDEEKVSSLLCGGQDYTDEIFDDEIVYKIPCRKFYVRTIELLQSAMNEKYSLKVFVKQSANNWRMLENYSIVGMHRAENMWNFIIRPNKK